MPPGEVPMKPAQRRHLRQLGCVPQSPSGRCVWEKSVDLFGAAHRIELVWSDEVINGSRILEEPGASPLTAWSFELVLTEGRWRVGAVEGPLFQMDEGASPAVSDVVHRVGAEVSGLRGSSPARAARPRPRA